MPTATTAAAFGARRSTHSLVVIGCPVSGSSPMPAQWPSPLIFSLGIEPSTTSTNGSSLPASASYQASMNSAPFSKASTGLCTTTFGMPGIAPGDDVLEARLGGRGHGDGVAVARQPGGHPDDVGGHRLRLVLVGYELRRCCHGLLSPQQIRGSGSPASRSITRLPPNAVSTSTIPGGSVLTSPISAASSQPGTARSAARAASAASGRHEGHHAALVGHVHAGRCRAAPPRPPPRAAPAPPPRSTTTATFEARASSLSTDATPPRVASRMQRSARAGRLQQRVRRRPQRAACRTRSPPRARTRRGPA